MSPPSADSASHALAISFATRSPARSMPSAVEPLAERLARDESTERCGFRSSEETSEKSVASP